MWIRVPGVGTLLWVPPACIFFGYLPGSTCLRIPHFEYPLFVLPEGTSLGVTFLEYLSSGTLFQCLLCKYFSGGTPFSILLPEYPQLGPLLQVPPWEYPSLSPPSEVPSASAFSASTFLGVPLLPYLFLSNLCQCLLRMYLPGSTPLWVPSASALPNTFLLLPPFRYPHCQYLLISAPSAANTPFADTSFAGTPFTVLPPLLVPSLPVPPFTGHWPQPQPTWRAAATVLRWKSLALGS